MNKERLQYLLERYQLKQCTEAEMKELNDWFHAWNPGTEDMQHWLQEVGGAEQLNKDLYTDFKQRIKAPARVINGGWLYRVAAASVILAILVFFFYPRKPSAGEQASLVQPTKKAGAAANDIKPGANKAILKLADGSEIVLSDTGKTRIATQNNTEITQVNKGVITYNALNGHSGKQPLIYNSLSTPRGGKYSLTLADGTFVTLDAASSITYPVTFTGNERRVEITGQAYFEVVHDAAHPFRVITKGQVIEDLGTSFNVSAYEDDQFVKVTLAEGSINMHNVSQTALLVPGQQALVKNGQPQIQVKKVNVEEVIAWKNGWFIFHHENIQTIMKQAARWYDVEIVYEGTPGDKKFGGKISRYVNISELLENLKIMGGIRYSIDGNKVVLMN